ANLPLAYMTVGYGCPFVGQRLQDSDLRRRYGINIASIQRGGELLPVPAGDTRIFPGDVLGVIATDEEIQRLLPVVEASKDENRSMSPTDFKLTSIQLSDKSSIVGRTVAQSRLTTNHKALLVSIDRDGEFITPDADTRFQPHDILWLVGNPKLLQALA
ncbi:MAG: TrkA C-terminal domain-containing protein, partial [Roseburia sp.]|nr:TrkA C-terminal domain-containing protein [Roseburia sp.]